MTLSITVASLQARACPGDQSDSTLWIVKERQPIHDRTPKTASQPAWVSERETFDGGGERDRTDAPLLAKQVLSQLSYTPNEWWVWLDSNQRPPPYQDGALTD